MLPPFKILVVVKIQLQPVCVDDGDAVDDDVEIDNWFVHSAQASWLRGGSVEGGLRPRISSNSR